MPMYEVILSVSVEAENEEEAISFSKDMVGQYEVHEIEGWD